MSAQRFSSELKEQVVLEVVEKDRTIAEVARSYSLVPQTAGNWVKKCRFVRELLLHSLLQKGRLMGRRYCTLTRSVNSGLLECFYEDKLKELYQSQLEFLTNPLGLH